MSTTPPSSTSTGCRSRTTSRPGTRTATASPSTARNTAPAGSAATTRARSRTRPSTPPTSSRRWPGPSTTTPRCSRPGASRPRPAALRERAADLRKSYEGWWSEAKGKYADGRVQGGALVFQDLIWNGVFPLYFGFVPAGPRRDATLRRIRDAEPEGIEIESYLPEILYRYGEDEAAYARILALADPAKERREYPEVPFAVVGAIATGLMGVSPDARTRTVETRSRLTAATDWAELRNLPVFDALIGIRHDGRTRTAFSVRSGGAVVWRAVFEGRWDELEVDGVARNATPGRDEAGRPSPGSTVTMAAGENGDRLRAASETAGRDDRGAVPMNATDRVVTDPNGLPRSSAFSRRRGRLRCSPGRGQPGRENLRRPLDGREGQRLGREPAVDARLQLHPADRGQHAGDVAGGDLRSGDHRPGARLGRGPGLQRRPGLHPLSPLGAGPGRVPEAPRPVPRDRRPASHRDHVRALRRLLEQDLRPRPAAGPPPGRPQLGLGPVPRSGPAREPRPLGRPRRLHQGRHRLLPRRPPRPGLGPLQRAREFGLLLEVAAASPERLRLGPRGRARASL